MINDLYQPYLPGEEDLPPFPLGRFIPKIRSGVISGWLKENASPGSWIIDPLGLNPPIDLEIARAGYRVLVTNNNPILSFLLEIIASAPQKKDLLSALSKFASIRRGQDRLETHLKSLYLTHCEKCRRSIPVDSFLWERDAQEPYARVYTCPFCGDEGQRPILSSDLEKLASLGNDRLHRARALERVNLGDSQTKESAKEALDSYLPRSLYVLFNIINKIEGLHIDEAQRKLLIAMAIMACDQGNTLWPWPVSRSRPRQLITPPQFRENNLWNAFEKSIEFLMTDEEPIPVYSWPEIPQENGCICLAKDKLKHILPLPNEIKLQGAVTAIQHSSQAFWTLNALWSGWIWGAEAVRPLRSALERQRYGWNWHAVAMHSVFKYLRKAADGYSFPIFGILPELEPGLLSAVMISAEASDHSLAGISLSEESGTAQLTWKQTNPTSPTTNIKIGEAGQDAIVDFLKRQNEPSSYIRLHAALLSNLSIKKQLPASLSRLPFDSISTLHAKIKPIFKSAGKLIRYESEAKNFESGLWWLKDTPDTFTLPLMDQIEEFVVKHYIDAPDELYFDELYQSLCEEFPGLLTPGKEYTRMILESYGKISSLEPDYWALNKQEEPTQRKQDIQKILEMLHKTGRRLGYQISGEKPLIWTNKNGEIMYLFYCFASSIISRYIYSQQIAPDNRCVLVMPGSRSRLLNYKLQKNPALARIVQSGWFIVKFRHIRRLAGKQNLTPELWRSLLTEDPPQWQEPTQLTMFS